MPANLKHQPNKFGSYQEIHNTVLRQFQERYFVKQDSLEFRPVAYGLILEGEIACRGNILVRVEKFVEIIDGTGYNATVQTKWYTYNVSLRGTCNLFRYDNQDDEFLRSGHGDEHHKHIFNASTFEEMSGSPKWVGESFWPTLGEVLQEAEDWYWENRDQLPSPEAFPELNLR